VENVVAGIAFVDFGVLVTTTVKGNNIFFLIFGILI